MKVPKEIYLLQKGSQLLGTWSETPQMEISGGWYSAEYKYIRADLVELEAAKKAKTDLAQDLLGWAETKLSHMEEGFDVYTGQRLILRELIEKIKSL